jgi:hypothetical protein
MRKVADLDDVATPDADICFVGRQAVSVQDGPVAQYYVKAPRSRRDGLQRDRTGNAGRHCELRPEGS